MIPFIKMNGAGNDFVVIDGRNAALPGLAYDKIANRHFGIGCDQVIVLESSTAADVRMRIFNADGSEVQSCGNASRCVGWLIAHENDKQKDSVRIETLAGLISARIQEGGQVQMDMGTPRLAWQDIPIASAIDTMHLPIEMGEFRDPVAVNMGNPHMVFFVADVESVPLMQIGPEFEHHPLFPERVNVSFAQVTAKDSIILRVWERGAGVTLACGTAACATLVAAVRRKLSARVADVILPGGTLKIEWAENDHVLMTGPVSINFTGMFDPDDYGALLSN